MHGGVTGKAREDLPMSMCAPKSSGGPSILLDVARRPVRQFERSTCCGAEGPLAAQGDIGTFIGVRCSRPVGSTVVMRQVDAACAGMMQSFVSLDPGFRRDDGSRHRARSRHPRPEVILRPLCSGRSDSSGPKDLLRHRLQPCASIGMPSRRPSTAPHVEGGHAAGGGSHAFGI